MMWNTKLAIFSQDCKIIFPALYNFENRVGKKKFGKHFAIFSFLQLGKIPYFGQIPFPDSTSWLLWLEWQNYEVSKKTILFSV